MAMQFADGTKTYKYDKETETQTLHRLDDLKCLTTTEFDNVREDLNNHIDHTVKFEDSTLNFMKTTEQMFNMYSHRVTMNYAKYLLFVNSRFFRFLNFFGQWYVYSGTKTKFNIDKIDIELCNVYYNSYDNYTKHMNSGYHIPLLSRIRYNHRLKKELKNWNR